MGDCKIEEAKHVQPTIFLPHGGGPMPLLGDAKHRHLTAYLQTIQASLTVAPVAILCVSAHWEERHPTIQTGKNPPLYFDYGGFPPESYQFKYPVPGAPDIGARIAGLLKDAGFNPQEDADRGYDHGMFVPLMLAFKEATIPVLQLSLLSSLDPAKHVALGKAIAPLREEGVLIVGSGMSFHNMRAFFSGDGALVEKKSKEFDDWLVKAVADPKRDDLLSNWKKAPQALYCHPREEHLLPLMVVAGAAGKDVGRQTYGGLLLGAYVSGFQFGES